jgi:hypothetical protein
MIAGIGDDELRDAASDGRNVLRVVRGTYDVEGGDDGSIGAHDLVDEEGNVITIPAEALVVAGLYDVQTGFASEYNAATIQIELDDGDGHSSDLKTAVAIDDVGNPYDAGRHAVVPVWATVATWLNPSQERNLRVTVDVEEVLDGKLTVFVVYFASE